MGQGRLFWILGLGLVVAMIALLRGVRIATSEQRDENGKRVNVTITVIAGFGNNINLSDTRINATNEPNT